MLASQNNCVIQVLSVYQSLLQTKHANRLKTKTKSFFFSVYYTWFPLIPSVVSNNIH